MVWCTSLPDISERTGAVARCFVLKTSEVHALWLWIHTTWTFWFDKMISIHIYLFYSRERRIGWRDLLAVYFLHFSRCKVVSRIWLATNMILYWTSIYSSRHSVHYVWKLYPLNDTSQSAEYCFCSDDLVKSKRVQLFARQSWICFGHKCSLLRNLDMQCFTPHFLPILFCIILQAFLSLGRQVCLLQSLKISSRIHLLFLLLTASGDMRRWTCTTSDVRVEFR